ncbi:MAG: response regulator [Thiovulaceae bacterium]|nr:response regulator [Sulfurimonadaceae bacterium]
MNVLIVDDSRTIRTLLKSMVSNYFKDMCNILEAEDGFVAMKQIEENRVDIILLDYNMPNMNGEEVVEVIRKNRKWDRTRIIMVTTEGIKEDVLRLIKKGADGYVVKPFREDVIFKTLDTIKARIVR